MAEELTGEAPILATSLHPHAVRITPNSKQMATGKGIPRPFPVLPTLRVISALLVGSVMPIDGLGAVYVII